MSNKKMEKALLAFMNEDVNEAKNLLRQVFLESAQKINKELDEEFENEVDDSEDGDEKMNEDVDQDPEGGLTSEVDYKLDEGFGEWDDGEENSHEDPTNFEHVQEADEENEVDEPVDGTEEFDAVEDEPVDGTEDKWKTAEQLFGELSEIFDQLKAGEESEEGQEELDLDKDDSEEPQDDFSDVQMGDEQMGESYKMKPVTEPDKKEKSVGNKKSPVAPNAKPVVPGAAPIKIKNGSVETTDKSFKNSDTMSAKVEDNNNVMDSGKNLMKNANVPKNKAENSKSPIAKRK